MNTTIWKYEMTLPDKAFDMPIGAIFLCAQTQNDSPTIWMSVNPEAMKEERRFTVVGTNGIVPQGSLYRGTCQCGNYVWHIYELTPKHIETLGGVDGKETVS